MAAENLSCLVTDGPEIVPFKAPHVFLARSRLVLRKQVDRPLQPGLVPAFEGQFYVRGVDLLAKVGLVLFGDLALLHRHLALPGD